MTWQKLVNLAEKRDQLVKSELVELKQTIVRLEKEHDRKQNELNQNKETCRNMESDFFNQAAPIITSQSLKEHKNAVRAISMKKDEIEKKIAEVAKESAHRQEDLAVTRAKSEAINRKLSKYQFMRDVDLQEFRKQQITQEELEQEDISPLKKGQLL